MSRGFGGESVDRDVLSVSSMSSFSVDHEELRGFMDKATTTDDNDNDNDDADNNDNHDNSTTSPFSTPWSGRFGLPCSKRHRCKGTG